MILSDREIRLAVQRGAILIDPPPPPEHYSSTAVDLELAATLNEWILPACDPGMGLENPRFRPTSTHFNFRDQVQRNSRTHSLADGATFDIQPRQFLLGWTHQKVRLPNHSRLAARVEGKSSLARLGLGIHVTAPTIHAGFGGDNGDPLQLEIWNFGPIPIELAYRMRICQLIFEEVIGTPERGYSGQFVGQGPSPMS